MGRPTYALAILALAAAAPSLAQDEQIGDWSISRLDNGATIASVSNNAGSIFGTICNSSGCTAFFNPQIECEDGHHYPSLVNAPSSAFPITLTCEKVGDLYLYSLPLEGAVMDAMSVGGALGIAFPMQSGEFQVARFSLTGAARAAARAGQLAKTATKSESQNASDNYSL